MNAKTEQLTYGAMITAVFGVLLLLNRQTGGFLEEALVYVFPIPMVAYAARYGGRSSIPVLISMSFIAFLCGTFTSVFYAISEACIGAVFGTRLHNKKDMTKTLLMVMLLSALANVLSMVVLASLFGYDLQKELAEMRNMLNRMMEQVAAAQNLPPEQAELMTSLFTPEFLRQMYIISMLFMGVIQGYIIYVVSITVLRRLRFPVPKAKPILEYEPPAWLGYVSLTGLMGYFLSMARPVEPEILQSFLQSFGLCAYLVLLVFGWIALVKFLRNRLGLPKILAVLLTFLAMACFTMALLCLGFFYLSTGFREQLKKEIRAEQNRRDLDHRVF